MHRSAEPPHPSFLLFQIPRSTVSLIQGTDTPAEGDRRLGGWGTFEMKWDAGALSRFPTLPPIAPPPASQNAEKRSRREEEEERKSSNVIPQCSLQLSQCDSHRAPPASQNAEERRRREEEDKNKDTNLTLQCSLQLSHYPSHRAPPRATALRREEEEKK